MLDSIVNGIKGIVNGIKDPIIAEIELHVNPTREYPSSTGKPPYIDLIKYAKNLIQIVEDLDYLRYEDFVSALVNVVNKGVKIDYFYYPSEENNKSSELLDKYKQYIDFYEIEKPHKHLIVVDRTDIEYESPHEPGKLPIRTSIWLYTEALGSKNSKKLDKMKKKAKHR